MLQPFLFERSHLYRSSVTCVSPVLLVDKGPPELVWIAPSNDSSGEDRHWPIFANFVRADL